MAGSPDVAFLRSPFAVENISRLKTCEVNLRRTWGQTYLTLATRLGLREVVEALINARADVDCRDNYNATPLCHAIDLPLDTGVLDVLLAAGADTLLVPHYRCGDVRLLRCIKGTAVTTPEPNYPQYHPVSDVLHLAVVRKRGPEHIALLLSYGTNVSRAVFDERDIPADLNAMLLKAFAWQTSARCVFTTACVQLGIMAAMRETEGVVKEEVVKRRRGDGMELHPVK